MNKTIRIGLRRPGVAMYGLGPILPACRIEIEDGDDLSRSRVVDQISVMEAPGRGGINAKSPSSVLRISARSRTHIEDAHFKNIAWFRVLDIYWTSKKMYPQSLPGASLQNTRRGAGSSPSNILLCCRPKVDTLRPRIAFDQKIIIVTAMVCQSFNRDKIARLDDEQRL